MAANLLNRTWQLVLYTRFYLALGAVLQVYVLAELLNAPFTPLFGLFIFFTLFAAYTLNRKTDQTEDAVNVAIGSERLVTYTYWAGVASTMLAVVMAVIVDRMILLPFGIHGGYSRCTVFQYSHSATTG